MLVYELPDYILHPTNLDSDNPGSGRGIAVYTHKSIEKSVIEITSSTSFDESCLLQIRLRGGDRLLFGCLYRSPTTSSKSAENNDNLNKLIQEIAEGNYSHVCIIGDFNFRDINWNTWTSSHHEESKEWKFINAVQSCFLHQHMTNPTRRRGNDEPSLLDLLFTNEAMQITDIQHHAPLGKSDHDVITFKFHAYLDFTKPKVSYVFEKGDYNSMKAHLSEINWKEVLLETGGGKSVETIWTEIKSKILYLRNRFVPKKKVEGKPTWSSKGTVPIDSTLRTAIREKKRPTTVGRKPRNLGRLLLIVKLTLKPITKSKD